MDEELRIDELALRAALAVAASGAAPPSARVSALPDRRMLRYYTTLGLLDRPAVVRGRTAYYGRRHLLQIVAIKRLQAAGASLAAVQRRLAGASTADLERLADLPAVEPAGAPAAAAAGVGAPAASAAVTGAAPAASAAVPRGAPATSAAVARGAPAASAAVAGAALAASVPVTGAAPAASAAAPAPGAPRRPFWRQPPASLSPAAIRLAPGVTLVLDAARPLSPDDHEAVRVAAAGLVDHLSTLLEER